jgi:hypothetical protein
VSQVRTVVRWRRVALTVALFAVFGALGVIEGASPASAGGIGECSITRGTPGAPTNLRVDRVDPLDETDPLLIWAHWSSPRNTTLGLDCRPILEYGLWMRDLTDGTDWSLIYQGQTRGTVAAVLKNHTVQLAVHARNMSGWSTDFAFYMFALL